MRIFVTTEKQHVINFLKSSSKRGQVSTTFGRRKYGEDAIELKAFSSSKIDYYINNMEMCILFNQKKNMNSDLAQKYDEYSHLLYYQIDTLTVEIEWMLLENKSHIALVR